MSRLSITIFAIILFSIIFAALSNGQPVIEGIIQSPQQVYHNEAVEISATISGLEPIDGWIFYDTGNGYRYYEMEPHGYTFSGTIPAQPEGATVNYYIQAEDSDHNITQSPLCSYQLYGDRNLVDTVIINEIEIYSNNIELYTIQDSDLRGWVIYNHSRGRTVTFSEHDFWANIPAETFIVCCTDENPWNPLIEDLDYSDGNIAVSTSGDYLEGDRNWMNPGNIILLLSDIDNNWAIDGIQATYDFPDQTEIYGLTIPAIPIISYSTKLQISNNDDPNQWNYNGKNDYDYIPPTFGFPNYGQLISGFPEIEHVNQNPVEPNIDEPVEIRAIITDSGNGEIENVQLHYEAWYEWHSIEMEQIYNDTFIAAIPGQPHSTRLTYYVAATNEDGNVSSSEIYEWRVPFVITPIAEIKRNPEQYNHQIVTIQAIVTGGIFSCFGGDLDSGHIQDQSGMGIRFYNDGAPSGYEALRTGNEIITVARVNTEPPATLELVAYDNYVPEIILLDRDQELPTAIVTAEEAAYDTLLFYDSSRIQVSGILTDDGIDGLVEFCFIGDGYPREAVGDSVTCIGHGDYWYEQPMDPDHRVYFTCYEEDLPPSKSQIAGQSVIDTSPALKQGLKQNYPNPFNPQTTITFSLNSSSNINLTVYNISGQLISILVDDFYSSGVYNAKFNGSEVPSGLYFYTLSINEKVVDTKQMVMLK